MENDLGVRKSPVFSFKALTNNKKDVFLLGFLIYTVFFVLGYFLLILPALRETGTLLSGDGASQYYPFLLQFRRDLKSFLSDPSSFPMVNTGFLYGGDTFTTSTMMFLPFLPVYFFSAFVPDSITAEFFAAAITLILYFSGAAFMSMAWYFGKNPLWSGVFAAFYAYCGNTFYTGIWNPHFLLMFIAFPLLITGIDKVIFGKSPLTLILVCAWLSIPGFTFLVYTIPFAGVFALIRLYFTKREKGAAEMLGCLAKGIGCILLGAALAGLFFVPCFIGFLGGGRDIEGSAVPLAEMLIPSLDNLSEFFSARYADNSVSICAAAVPAVLYTLFSRKVKKEYKIYTLAAMLVISLPLIWYGVNGFLYTLCRWGFIPAAYASYVSVSLIPEMLKADKRDTAGYIICTMIFLILFLAGIDEAAIIFAAVCGLITAVPPLERLLGRFENKCFDRLSLSETSGSRKLLVILCLVIIIAAAAAAVLMLTGIFEGLYPLAVSLLLVCIAMLVPRLTDKSAGIMPLMLAAAYTVSFVLQSSDIYYLLFLNDGNELLKPIEDIAGQEKPLTYFCDMNKEALSITDYSQDSYENTMYLNEISHSVLTMFDNFIIYYKVKENITAKTGIPSAEGFVSSIDGDLVSFLNRSGLDTYAYPVVVSFCGFNGREAMYSLFGTKYLYSEYLTDDLMFGLSYYDHYDVGDTGGIYVYKNDYALPAGVTYSMNALKTRAWYDSLSGDELPYAFMNGICLEGYDHTASDESGYSHVCDVKHNRTVLGYNQYNVENTHNELLINEDVSGCFLSLSFTVTECKAAPGAGSVPFAVNIDDKRILHASVETGASNWKRGISQYRFDLGNYENGAGKIVFDAQFAIDPQSVRLTAIPTEVYTGAYEALTEETLQNISLSKNTITGSISLASDKILSLNLVHSDGWKAYCDGVQVPVYKANGLFLGIPLSAGDHDIRLVYTTPGLVPGAAVTCCAAAAVVIVMVFYKKKSKVKSQNV